MQSFKLPNEHFPVFIGILEGLYILLPSEHSLHSSEYTSLWQILSFTNWFVFLMQPSVIEIKIK